MVTLSRFHSTIPSVPKSMSLELRRPDNDELTAPEPRLGSPELMVWERFVTWELRARELDSGCVTNTWIYTCPGLSPKLAPEIVPFRPEPNVLAQKILTAG